MKLNKYYPVDKPSIGLYNKVYASVPVKIYEESISMFWTGVAIVLGTILAPSIAMADMLDITDLDTILNLMELYIGE